jgi:hypothetical protein
MTRQENVAKKTRFSRIALQRGYPVFPAPWRLGAFALKNPSGGW